MSWRSVFGLDAVEFIIFWAVSIVIAFTIGVMGNMPEMTFLLLAVAAVGYAFLRRRVLKQLPDQLTGRASEELVQLQEDQQAATDYFERKIAELEERLDFAERLLARGEEHGHVER